MTSTASTPGPSVCFKVSKIIGISMGEGNLRNYQVQWEPSWVSAMHLVGCEKLIEEFIRGQSNDIKTDDIVLQDISEHMQAIGGTAEQNAQEVSFLDAVCMEQQQQSQLREHQQQHQKTYQN